MSPQTALTMRASSNGSKSSSPPAFRLSRTGPSPKLVTTSAIPTLLAMATPFHRPSPWWASS